MAPGVNTYGTVAIVESLVGDLVSARTFTTLTTPKLAQVEAFLDQRAAEINMELQMTGFSIPILSATNPTLHAYLQSLNSYGAAAFCLSSLPAESYTSPEFETVGRSRKDTLEKIFQDGLKRIREFRVSTGTELVQVFAGSQEDSDGVKKKPMFTRGMSDFPGSRSLKDIAEDT